MIKFNSKITAVFIILCAVVFGGIYIMVDRDRRQQQDDRQKLGELMEKINLGDSKSNIGIILGDKTYARLTLIRESEDEWIIKTPLEFGAANWILLITFDNGLAISLKIRTEDSIDIKPIGAHDDKIK